MLSVPLGTVSRPKWIGSTRSVCVYIHTHSECCRFTSVKVRHILKGVYIHTHSECCRFTFTEVNRQHSECVCIYTHTLRVLPIHFGRETVPSGLYHLEASGWDQPQRLVSLLWLVNRSDRWAKLSRFIKNIYLSEQLFLNAYCVGRYSDMGGSHIKPSLSKKGDLYSRPILPYIVVCI